MEPLYARYPFLTDARAAVEAADIDLAKLVRADRSPEVARAVERIEGAVSGGRVPDPIGDARVELLSYPIARVLVSLVDEPVLTDRYALAEARRAFDLLAGDLHEPDTLRSGSSRRLTLEDLLRDFGLGDAVDERDSGYDLAVTAFLGLSADLRDTSWRLVNRSLADGMVPVTRPELETLLREAIRDRVADGLPLHVPDPIASVLDDEVRAIEESLADVTVPQDVNAVIPELFPPCMERHLARLRDDEPVQELERFAAVSFLTAIGMDEDEVVTFLDADDAPSEQLVRYQVRHVHGATRSTAYPPPSCATMQGAGACVDSPDRCESDGHALAAYARRLAEAGELSDWRDDPRSEPA